MKHTSVIGIKAAPAPTGIRNVLRVLPRAIICTYTHVKTQMHFSPILMLNFLRFHERSILEAIYFYKIGLTSN